MNEVIPRTKRGAEWNEFADKVLTHIDTYTVPQYGDKGKDSIDKWDINMCLITIIKYATRSGSNIRSNQDKLDMLKIAHYACFVYNKLKEKETKMSDGINDAVRRKKATILADETKKQKLIRKIQQLSEDILESAGLYSLDVVTLKGQLAYDDWLAKKYRSSRVLSSDKKWLRFEIGQWTIAMEGEGE